MPFDFKVLTEFEVGQAMAAIEGIARLDKPLAEVGCRIARAEDLERDLLACVESAGETNRVLPWIRPAGQHLRFGYYAEPWALKALDFLDRTDLEATDRYWISGLLFGYRSAAIQRFIARSGDESATPHPTSRTLDTVEMTHRL